MGDKGANFVFMVMGVITSDRKHFSNTDPLCIASTQVCVCGGGGGGKNWASSFQVILGFLVVSLQLEPADARVLVEHPVPRCPSCTPVLFGVHVNIFSCAMEIFLIRYWNIFSTVTSEQSFFTKTASNTIEVDLF